MEMRAQENLGRVFIALNERRRGMEKLIKAAEMASKDKKSEDLIRIIGFLRSLAIEDNNIDNAVDYNKQIFQCLRRVNSTASEMEEDWFDAYYCQGQIDIKSGQFRDAKNNLLRAKRILAKRKPSVFKEDTVQNLTKELNTVAKILRVLSELGQTDDTEPERIVSLYEKLGDMNSGTCAIWYYEKGVQLCLEADREIELAAPLYSSIAAAKREMGLRNEALNFYQKELEILKQRGSSESDIVRTLLTMSYCLQEDGGKFLDDTVTTDANSASIKLLKNALIVSETVASTSLMGKVLRALLEVYERNGEQENANLTRSRLSKVDIDDKAVEEDEVESEEELVPLSDLELEISDEDNEDHDLSKSRTRKRNYREMAKNEKGKCVK